MGWVAHKILVTSPETGFSINFLACNNPFILHSGENLVSEQASQGKKTSEETWRVYYERQDRCRRYRCPSQPHGGNVRCVAKRDVMIIKMLTSCRVRSPGSHGPHDAPSATSFSSSLRVGGGVHYLVIPGSDLAQSAFHPKPNINCILSMLILK